MSITPRCRSAALPTASRSVAILALALAACAGNYGGRPPAKPQDAAAAPANLDAAKLPYELIDARTGKSIDEPAFWTRVAAARAVCVGEEHRNPHHHWVQLHVVRELLQRLPKGAPVALAMEMFQRPFQGALDDYAAKKIDAAQLRSRTGYAERWGYDYGFYGPTIDAAVAGGAQLLAANAPRELTKKLVRKGLESLTPEEKAQLPELKLDDAAHRAWFDALMEDMGGAGAHGQRSEPKSEEGKGKPEAKASPHGGGEGTGPSADRVYLVQVAWDETMADTAAKWLAAHPTGHLILLAGNGHCHDSAIIRRLQRRGVADAISLRSAIDDSEGGVADVLVHPINDFVVVLKLPAGAAPAPQQDGGW